MHVKNGNAFWGVVFLAAAAILLAGKMGFLGGLSFWPIAMSVILAAFLVKGFMNGSFGMMLFSAAFLAILHAERLHLEDITPWPVLGAALLGTIGLNMLFPRFGRRWRHYFRRHSGSGRVVGEEHSGTSLRFNNVFGSVIKYVQGDIEYLEMNKVFGNVSLYFMDAHLPSGILNMEVDSIFGYMEVYVPSSWNVTVNGGTFGSRVKETGRCVPDGSNQVHINGNAIFGYMSINYV